MKIGDRCFVHGYVDEIRKDTVIIRNSGGYFGTDPSEVTAAFDTERTGKWIDNGYDTDGTHYIKCSLCELDTEGYDYDFCPNCGARMES